MADRCAWHGEMLRRPVACLVMGRPCILPGLMAAALVVLVVMAAVDRKHK